MQHLIFTPIRCHMARPEKCLYLVSRGGQFISQPSVLGQHSICQPFNITLNVKVFFFLCKQKSTGLDILKVQRHFLCYCTLNDLIRSKDKISLKKIIHIICFGYLFPCCYNLYRFLTYFRCIFFKLSTMYTKLIICH